MKKLYYLVIACVISQTIHAQAPVVNLGPDITVCNSTVLNAGNAGSSYHWSQGAATTQTLTVTTSGSYSVTVTNSSGTASDNIIVTVLPSPTVLPINSVSVCNGQTASVTATGIGNLFQWYDAPTGGNLIGLGSTYTQSNMQSSTTVYAQSSNTVNAVGGLTTSTGLTPYFTNSNSGNIFDAYTNFFIDSVAVYALTVPVTITIQLQNAAGTVMAQTNWTVTTAGKSFVPLHFYVPTGNSYKLIRSGGGALYIYGPNTLSYPYITPGVISMNGWWNAPNTIQNYYPYFFDWRLSQVLCSSARVAVPLSVASIPTIAHSVDTVICASNYNLVAGTGSGVNYSWSSGQTTSSINVTTTGVYNVTASVQPACPATASYSIHLLPQPAVTPASSTGCLGQTLNLPANGVGQVFQWYSAATGGNLLATGSTYTVNNLQSATTVYVQASNKSSAIGGLTSSTGFPAYYTNSNSGNLFDAYTNFIIDSVAIYATTVPSGITIELQNSSGTTIASLTTTVTVSGKSFIPLNFYVPAGTNYKLVRTGGGAFNIYGPATFNYPYITPGVISMNGWWNAPNNITSYYPYFFDWHLSTLICTSARAAYAVSIAQVPAIAPSVDTTICSANYALTATSGTGLSYSWSTGQTTNSINVTNSGTYSVTAWYQPACPATATYTLHLLPAPYVNPSTGNTVCLGQNTQITATGAGNVFQWYDAPTGGNLLSSTANYSLSNIQSATTLYAQAANTTPATGGLANSNGYPAFYTNSNTGNLFDAYTDFIIDSVAVYAQTIPVTITIELQNSSNTTMASTSVTINTVGKSFVPINFFVPAGNNYKLLRTGGGALNIYGSATFNYPYVTPGVISMNGWWNASNTYLNYYPYFFDWHLSKLTCRSNRVAFPIGIAQVPAIMPTVDTTVCSNNYALTAATGTGLSYSWSSGQTTNSIALTQSGVYSVTAWYQPACPATATYTVHLSPAPYVNPSSGTTVCVGQNTQITATGTGDLFQWYDASTGNHLLSNSAVYSFSNIQSSATLYAQAANVSHVTGGLTTSNGYPAFYTNSNTGNLFDAYTDFIIDSVAVYAQTIPVTITIELQDNSGATLASTSVTVNTVGKSFVPINFFVPAGNNYKLVRTGGGALNIYGPATFSYPYITPGVISMNGWWNAPNTYPNYYPYFFDWHLSKLTCTSTRVPYTVNVVSMPSITPSVDTTICANNYTLVAGAGAGVNYQWSTGQTTSSIPLTHSGTYTVSAWVQPACPVNATYTVALLPVPSITNSASVSVCQGDSLTITANGVGQLIRWYDAPTGGNTITTGSTYKIPSAQNSAVYYADAVNLGHANGGLVNSGTQPPYLTNNESGTLFDAYTDFVIDSVAVYTQSSPVAMTIQLQDANGTVMATRSVVVNTVGRSFIPVNFYVPAGNDYKLMKDGTSILYIYGPSTFNYPYITPGVISIRAWWLPPNIVTSYYSYFFDWHLSTIECASSRQAFPVTVVPNPVLTLQDTAVCGQSNLVLDAANAGAAYHWSNGATTQTITATSNNCFSVTVTNGGICTTTGNTCVQFFQPPSTPVLNTTNICQSGYQHLLTPLNNEVYTWYTSPTSTSPFFVGAPYDAYIDTSRTYYIEAASRASKSTGQTNNTSSSGSNFSNFGIATLFDVHQPIILDSIGVYANHAVSFTLNIRDQTGHLLFSRNEQVNASNQKVFIPVDYSIPVGTDYRISFTNLTGGGLATSSVSWPLGDNRIQMTGNSINNSVNYYFYDWHYSYPLESCRSSRVPYTVNVRHPFDLADSVYVCTGTVLNAQSTASTYLWSNGATTPSIQVSQPGVYTVAVTANNGGCIAHDTAIVAMPAPVALPADGLLCGNILNSGYAPPSQIVWSTGGTTPTIPITHAGNYSVTVTEPNGCVLTDQINVTGFASLPVDLLPADTALCQQGVLTWPANGSTYQWSTGSTSNALAVNTTGNYTVTVTDSNHCTAAFPIQVNVDQPSVASFTYQIAGNGLRVEFTNTSGSGDYSWNFGFGVPSVATDPVVIFPSPGTYTVSLTVTNACGTNTFQQSITVNYTGIVNTPTEAAISLFPNPAHDQLTVKREDGTMGTIEVWNTQGQRIKTLLSAASTHTTFDISDLSAGLYMVIIFDPANNARLRSVLFVKE